MKMEKALSRLKLDLPSLEATYLVTSSPGPTSRNRQTCSQSSPPPPHPTPGQCWGSLPSDLKKIISSSQRDTGHLGES